MATLADSEINFQDYADLCNFDDLSDEDVTAIFAALFEDTLPISNQLDSNLASISSSTQEHSYTIQPPKSPTKVSVPGVNSTIHATEEFLLSTDDNQKESSLPIPEAPPVPPEEIYCGICMETKPRIGFFNTNFCTHLYCNECVASYVIDKVEDNVGWINCPEPGCEAGFLDPDTCHLVIPQSVIDRWGRLICEPMIQIYCGICMETKPRIEFFNTNFCTHLYCNECVASYVIDKVEDNVGWINCPKPGCEAGFLDPDTCHLVIPQSVIDRWGKLICEAMIQVKFYCPYKDCSAVLMNDHESSLGEQEIITVSECPYCYRLFCAQCLTAWHQGVNCEEFQQLDEGERGAGDLMLREAAHSSKWQRCPKCRIFVEKNNGCNHITCRCKFEFCYVCGKNWSSSHYNCRTSG